MTEPILSLRGVNKSFGPVHVLKDVNLDVHPGQVTALVGDNGAGKSTLIKCIAGIYTPDHGEFKFDGWEENGDSRILRILRANMMKLRAGLTEDDTADTSLDELDSLIMELINETNYIEDKLEAADLD